MQKYDELLIALRKVIRAIDLHSKQLNKTSGLTGPQLLIMHEVAQTDGITASRIAQNVNLSPATVTNILDRLESRALVSRVRSQLDKRRVSLYLTEQGKALLDQAPQPLQDHFIEKFSSLSEWEQTLLLSSMQRIAAMMDADNIDASPLLEVGAITRQVDPGKSE
ncbi:MULTISPECIES: MarR family winged helix-turn-helix transcriptional regulator [Pseudoalteromonas]|uniref:Transcriptional regulator n=1 Tax=Pseudoalteromonas ruthenica TaxID=151081 RepID=A0A0F4PW70_9GAMM|nr:MULTISPECIES: MarR family transcriptional regulator [Pseudoalteromonas]KJY97355.1 transcriptional regulator [Pseudoalteromonas ruthenica]KJY99303.1 transcriptional regulator [Pseudoalteromonas ruthenica]MCF2863716.1 MarR family transcriptional regulator [Pseudoalteromonas sp. CNAT2-18]MCG7543955.1 MarR family transcriptional regulator [Pseudoalteromonas sp. MM17-2]MCG7559534.1 MarR family transcriptional regulator [Pseudoalteromonas sp. CNAT2-18.1]